MALYSIVLGRTSGEETSTPGNHFFAFSLPACYNQHTQALLPGESSVRPAALRRLEDMLARQVVAVPIRCTGTLWAAPPLSGARYRHMEAHPGRVLRQKEP